LRPLARRLQHPDKNPDAAATAKFQALSFVHALLSNADKRRAYDATGKWEEGADDEDFEQWYDYYRSLHPAVTEEQIAAFEVRAVFAASRPTEPSRCCAWALIPPR